MHRHHHGAGMKIRAFNVKANTASGKYEFHLRGVKVAEASLFTPRGHLDAIADNLSNLLHREIKFLGEHPEASLAPAHEADPAAMVPTLADL